ncbi:hypothetical protein ABW21_db0208831 [Orbilia brochopaga]|nr:hypothetical protein ABW21_db0208831 [Drechslerella brochopaga]
MEPNIKAPYYASDIPGSLPTIEEMENGEIIVGHNGWKVSRVGQFIVKYGDSRTLSLIEGENMLFVQQATKSEVKVPKVYALFTATHNSHPHNFIVMEYLEGNTLQTMWPSLSKIEKENITSKLQTYFDLLRKIPPPGYYGSIGRRPLRHGMFWTQKETPSINGPFESEKDLNEALVLKYILDFKSSAGFKPDFYRRALGNVFKSHPPCFTHADFQPKNVIVKKPRVEGTDDMEVTLIDWECSGWLPSYWEYSSTMLAHHFKDDWGAWVPKMLETFDSEFSWYQMLYLELWS